MIVLSILICYVVLENNLGHFLHASYHIPPTNPTFHLLVVSVCLPRGDPRRMGVCIKHKLKILTLMKKIVIFKHIIHKLVKMCFSDFFISSKHFLILPNNNFVTISNNEHVRVMEKPREMHTLHVNKFIGTKIEAIPSP